MLQELICPIDVGGNASGFDTDAAFDAHLNHDPVNDPKQVRDHGFFPVSVNGFWHGGVHLEGPARGTSCAVRAIADGEIVAYRINRTPQTMTFKGKEQTFSSAFALLRHSFETPDGEKLRFFSLYMHLAPFSELKASQVPPLFLKCIYTVKTQEDGLGLTMFDENGAPFKTIPRGATFQILEKNPPLPRWANGEAFWRVEYTHKKTKAEERFSGYVKANPSAAQVKDNVGTVTQREMGINIRESEEPKAAVRYVAPKGTRLRFKEHGAESSPKALKANLRNELANGGFVYFGDGIDASTVIDPSLPDAKVVVPNEPISVVQGDLLGYTGSYMDRTPYLHFEIFTSEETNLLHTIKHAKPQEQRKYLLLNAGAVLCNREEYLDGKTLKYRFEKQAGAVGHEPGGPSGPVLAAEVGLPLQQDGKTYRCVYYDRGDARCGWIAENDPGVAETISPYDTHKIWQVIKESGEFATDAFCDNPDDLFKLIGIERPPGKPSPTDAKEKVRQLGQEIFRAVHNKQQNQILKRVACTAPTEWAASVDGKKFDRLLEKDSPWPHTPQEFQETMNHINGQMQWWDEVKARLSELPHPSRVCHFHPVGFIEWFNMFTNPYNRLQECQGPECRAYNLRLGFNVRYRPYLIDAALSSKLQPWALAALINAEAEPMKVTIPGRPRIGPDGRALAGTPAAVPHVVNIWNPRSYNRDTGATGLTQFIAGTWMDMAADSGSYLNLRLAHEGYVLRKKGGVIEMKTSAVVNGKATELWETLKPETHLKLLDFRKDPELSIRAAAEYAVANLHYLETQKTAKTGAPFSTAGLDDLAKAKLVYLMHHEGSGGAVAFLNGVCERSPESCERVLKARLQSTPEEETRLARTELLAQREQEDAAAEAAIVAEKDAKESQNKRDNGVASTVGAFLRVVTDKLSVTAPRQASAASKTPPKKRLTDQEIDEKAKALAPERAKQRGEERAKEYYEEAGNDWQEAFMRWKLERQLGTTAHIEAPSYYAREGTWFCAYRRWFLSYIERRFQREIVKEFVCDVNKLPANLHTYKVVLAVGGQHPADFTEDVTP